MRIHHKGPKRKVLERSQEQPEHPEKKVKFAREGFFPLGRKMGSAGGIWQNPQNYHQEKTHFLKHAVAYWRLNFAQPSVMIDI
jgi:hypothetical protein